MSSTDSTSITTGKIKINGKQVWHLFARSMIYCFQHWKTVLILSLLFAFITIVAIAICFISMFYFAKGATELFQFMELLDNANALGSDRFGAVTLIIFLLLILYFISTSLFIAWYRYILAIGDKNILRSFFRWGNKHTRYFLWLLVLPLITVLADFILFIGFAGAFVEFVLPLANKGGKVIASILLISSFILLFLFVLGVTLRASLIFPCLAVSSDISIKQIFNKTASNFNTFCLLIPLLVILIFLITIILGGLARLTRFLLNNILYKTLGDSWLTDALAILSVIITEFTAFIIPSAFSFFWLATFIMFIASHFFPAQFKSLSSK